MLNKKSKDSQEKLSKNSHEKGSKQSHENVQFKEKLISKIVDEEPVNYNPENRLTSARVAEKKPIREFFVNAQRGILLGRSGDSSMPQSAVSARSNTGGYPSVTHREIAERLHRVPIIQLNSVETTLRKGLPSANRLSSVVHSNIRIMSGTSHGKIRHSAQAGSRSPSPPFL